MIPSRSTWGAFAGALVAVACAGSGQPSEVPLSPAPAEPAASSPAAAPTASEPPPQTPPAPAERSELPEAFAALGQPCGEASGPEAEILCDTRGVVAGVWVPVDAVQDVPPARAEIIRLEPREEGAPGRELSVGVEDERLWVSYVTCGTCRRIMGWAFVGDLRRLSEVQLRAAQKRLGLPDSAPTLKTAAAWRDWYKGRPAPAKSPAATRKLP